VKKLLDFSKRPASAFHQAMKAVIKPKTPATRVTFAWATPLSWFRCAMASRRKVISKKTKSEQNATVDLRVHRTRRKVKMNHLKNGLARAHENISVQRAYAIKKYPRALFNSAGSA
jgi:hypothetical protein